MKKNKLIILTFTLALMLVFTVACQPKNTNMRNLSTQTRVRNNMLDNNTRLNTGTNTQDTPGRFDTTGRESYDTNDMMGNNNTNLNNGMVRNNNNNLTTNLTNARTTADNLAKKISNLPEVNSASVLLTGNTAIVGCDIKGNVEGKMTSSVKQKIENIVKDSNNNIQNVSITADPDLYTRIRTMATDMGNGNPIKGFTNEIQEILRRITPTTR